MDIIKQKAPSGWTIQSIILSKTKFKTQGEATSWIREHGFKTSHAGKGVDETKTSWRFRQRDPGDFSQFRTITLTDGVSAVYGKLKNIRKAECRSIWEVLFNYITT